MEALERSINMIVNRHEVLRASFAMKDDHLVQVADDDFIVEVPLVNIDTIAAEEREQQCLRIAQAESEQPFDLGVGPLVRAKIVRLSEEDHVFLLTLHHICCDAWSIEILFRELVAGYRSELLGEAFELLELEVQYADFAHWQREWVSGEELARQLSYWKETLAEVAVLELPADRARPSVPSHCGATQSFVLSEELSSKLAKLSRLEDCTLFMTLLAAFQVLLYRYSRPERHCDRNPHCQPHSQ